MKWFNKEHRNIFLKQIKEDLALNKDERYVLKYSPLAFKHARAINTEESRVGILNCQDIEQIAFMAMLEAWNALDWDKIEGSANAEKTTINYLSSNISGRIKRYILRLATGVSIPQDFITKNRKEELVDALFGNWLYSFRIDDISHAALAKSTYADIIEWRPDSSKYDNDILNDKLTDVMHALTRKEVDIIMWSYGLMGEKLSSKQIAERLDISPGNVRIQLMRAIKKLDTEENREFFKDFL